MCGQPFSCLSMSRLIFRFPLLDISKYALTSPSTISSRLWQVTCSEKYTEISSCSSNQKNYIFSYLIAKHTEESQKHEPLCCLPFGCFSFQPTLFWFSLGFPRILRHLIRYKCNITQQQTVEVALHSFKRKCVRLPFFIFFFIVSLFFSPAHSLLIDSLCVYADDLCWRI